MSTAHLTPCVSINLTNGTSEQIPDEMVPLFDAPVAPFGLVNVVEVVMWSAKLGEWLFIVANHTGRTFAPGTREVTPEEFDYYEEAFRLRQAG